MKAPSRFGVFITPFHPTGQSPTVALQYDMEASLRWTGSATTRRGLANTTPVATS